MEGEWTVCKTWPLRPAARSWPDAADEKTYAYVMGAARTAPEKAASGRPHFAWWKTTLFRLTTHNWDKGADDPSKAKIFAPVVTWGHLARGCVPITAAFRGPRFHRPVR